MDLRFRRTTADRLQVKGNLSEDGTYMTYHGDNGEEQNVTISDMLDSFKGGAIEMTVTLKSEEELYIAATEDPGTITPAGSDDDDGDTDGDGSDTALNDEDGENSSDDENNDGNSDDDSDDDSSDNSDDNSGDDSDDDNGDSNVMVGDDSDITIDD